jgi:MftR C-terminal domain
VATVSVSVSLARYEEALEEAIAARTGTDLEQDMYPRILAGAVIAAACSGCRRAGERGRTQATGWTTRLKPNGCGRTPSEGYRGSSADPDDLV